MEETLKKIMAFSVDIPDLQMQIDPTAFERYDILQVPAVVVSDGDDFKVMYGNVSLEESLRRLDPVPSHQTMADAHDDLQEGLSRLSALMGSAEEVASHQVHEGVPGVFQGVVQTCKKYPLGTRDCCTDRGFLDGLMHCPAAMQVLQRAKSEGRVVSLGHYTRHRAGSKHYVYCVFPSKLAGIVQIQGRGAQLHIPFGSAKAPDCRGLRPEELEKIDFKQLDLSAVLRDLHV